MKISTDLGFAGKLAKTFIKSKLTPVLAVFSILVGLVAVWLTPKEEEPQISVPMIDITTPAPGFEAKEVERRVTEPIERAVWGLEGVEYVYSASRPHGSLVTVRFKVGEPIEPSLVKIHHKLMEVSGELPPASRPQVKSFSIDDVPFLTLTFTSEKKTGFELRSLVAPLARELSSTPDLSRVEMQGGQRRALRVIVDPVRLSSSGASLLEVAQALKNNDRLAPSGKTWGKEEVFDVDVGGTLRSVEDLKSLAIGQRGGRVLTLSEVAEVVDGPEELTRTSLLIEGRSPLTAHQAVSISFAKRKGTNVVVLADELISRAETFRKKLPEDIQVHILRNYGATAAEKSNELIEHLLLATLSVTALIALAMGLRPALVVAIAIPVTLALTLALYYFMGYTLNRVTLFALIFSIGILVDDAIVVVENIERHLKEGKHRNLVQATLAAVSEVGNPTILATFTVIAAILPMAFVRGLMGPYMKPIPVGASLAMILSLFVAFIVTPWASVKFLKHDDESTKGSEKNSGERGADKDSGKGPEKTHGASSNAPVTSRLDRLYQSAMDRLLTRRTWAMGFGAFTVVLLIGSMALVYFKSVKVKMLPFDNKNEFQVLVDYPPTTPLSVTTERTRELATLIAQDSNVEMAQLFVGEPAPFSFSGMVKHTFLRGADYQADVQVVLKDKHQRKLSSHEVIQGLRGSIADFGRKHQAVTKVLEIPPGPPVLATMVAEVYGPDEETRTKVASELQQIFSSEASVVDLDVSWRETRPRKQYLFDYSKGGSLGLQAASLQGAGSLLFAEVPALTLHDVSSPEDVSIDLSVAQTHRSGPAPFGGLSMPSFETGLVQLQDALKVADVLPTRTLHRKNLKPVSYVTSELSGAEEAPVYGIMKLAPQISYPTQTAEVPWNTTSPVVKWDGEWFITYEVFRDLGGAFAVVMVLIYVLVLGWFRSFAVPLVIMAPIPISLIGILPGHAMLGAFFTATSMIGFIAGAGIIVRNSIILVDFVEHQLKTGMALKDAVISAGVLRFRPMLLTAAAVVVGSSIMLADPIFQGLAISLMFGEIAATILSRVAVPVLYFWFIGKSRVKYLKNQETEEVYHDNSPADSRVRGHVYSH